MNSIFKIKYILSLFFIFCSYPAFSDGLDVAQENKIQKCIEGILLNNLHSCIDDVYENCLTKLTQTQCNYTVSLATYELYSKKASTNRKSIDFIDKIGKLIHERCSVIANIETDRAARNWTHSRCIFEGTILSILADNPLAKRE